MKNSPVARLGAVGAAVDLAAGNTAQWVIPALTGAVTVLNVVHSEQQRPGQQAPGILTKPAQLLKFAS